MPFFKGSDEFSGSDKNKMSVISALDKASEPLSVSALLELGQEIFTLGLLRVCPALSKKLEDHIVKNALEFVTGSPCPLEGYVSLGLKEPLRAARDSYREKQRVCDLDLVSMDEGNKETLERLMSAHEVELSKKEARLHLKVKKQNYDQAQSRMSTLSQQLTACHLEQESLEREALYRETTPDAEIFKLERELLGKTALTESAIQAKRSEISTLLQQPEPDLLKYGRFTSAHTLEVKGKLVSLKAERERLQETLARKAQGLGHALSLNAEQSRARARIAEIDREIPRLRREIALLPVGEVFGVSGGREASTRASTRVARLLQLEKEIDENTALVKKQATLQALRARKTAIEKAKAKKVELDAKQPVLDKQFKAAQGAYECFKGFFDLAKGEYDRFETEKKALLERSKSQVGIDLEAQKNARRATLSREAESIASDFKARVLLASTDSSTGTYPVPSAPFAEGEENPMVVE